MCTVPKSPSPRHGQSQAQCKSDAPWLEKCLQANRFFQCVRVVVIRHRDGGADSWHLAINADGRRVAVFPSMDAAILWVHRLQADRRQAEKDARQAKSRAKAFALENEPPAHKPATFDNAERTRQRKLIDGLDCLPGQQDLF